MSEMLGNRYLLELRFEEAIPHFESRLRREPADRRTAQKLALCHALSGHRDAAVRWVRRALEASVEESLPEEVIWRELVAAIRSRAGELGPTRSALGLALARLFRDPAEASGTLEHAMEDAPDVVWLRDVLLAFERRLEASDDTTL
jgi:tetratricopeptide (TPR) repeat protein